MRGKKFEGLTNEERVSNVVSSTSCSIKCLEKTSCLYWTWMDPSGTNPSKCILNEGFTKVVHDEHAVSGDRSCKGSSGRAVFIKSYPNYSVFFIQEIKHG